MIQLAENKHVITIIFVYAYLFSKLCRTQDTNVKKSDFVSQLFALIFIERNFSYLTISISKSAKKSHKLNITFRC